MTNRTKLDLVNRDKYSGCPFKVVNVQFLLLLDFMCTLLRCDKHTQNSCVCVFNVCQR